MNQKMKILFAGGGTMGSVSPLLAVYQEIKERKEAVDFLFIGTTFGPEKQSVEGYKIPFTSIASGKLRRYFDWRNFTDPFKVVQGFFQAIKIIRNYKPNAVMIAGAFVGVPVALAAWLLRIPVLVHQQDIETGLANKLMAPFAQKISVSFDVSLKEFNSAKVILTGNPIRNEFYECDRHKSLKLFNLKEELPVILITGGGTGSQKINQIVKQAMPEIAKFAQVIHTTGLSKGFVLENENYHQYEFLSHEMPEALCVADLVVSRAGLSTLTELSIAGKPTVLIPIYKTHQEFNAAYYQRHNAVMVVSEPSLNAKMFAEVLRDVLSNKERLNFLSENIKKIMPSDGAKRVSDLLISLAK